MVIVMATNAWVLLWAPRGDVTIIAGFGGDLQRKAGSRCHHHLSSRTPDIALPWPGHPGERIPKVIPYRSPEVSPVDRCWSQREEAYHLIEKNSRLGRVGIFR